MTGTNDMTANADDSSQLVAMARSGLATHMLRILPEAGTGSGLSGGAEEGAVLDLIADHLDTPVFRLGQGRYALDARAEQIDGLMRAIPELCPQTEFTVQEFIPPDEKASDTQSRVISRIECATEAIQAVLSRLQQPAPAAVEPDAGALIDRVMAALADRDAALFTALDARLAPGPGPLAEAELPPGLEARLDRIESALRAHPDASADGMADLRAAVLEAVAETENRLLAQLDRKRTEIAAQIEAHLAARAEGFETAQIADDLQAIRSAGEAEAARRDAEETALALATRLDALQERLDGLPRQAQETIDRAAGARMAGLEAALANAIEDARPGPDMLDSFARAIDGRLEDLDQRLAASEAAMVARDARLEAGIAALANPPESIAEALRAALDDQHDAQASKLAATLAMRLAQQPLPEELRGVLTQMEDRLKGLGTLMCTLRQTADESVAAQTEELIARIGPLLSTAADDVAGQILGAEELLQARLEAYHSALSARIMRQLAELGARAEALAVPHNGTGDIQVIERVEGLGAGLEAFAQADAPALAARIEALEMVLEAGFVQIAALAGAVRPETVAAALEPATARLGALDDTLAALRDHTAAIARRLEESEGGPQVPPAGADRAGMASTLSRIETRLARIEDAATPGQTDGAALEALGGRLERALERAAPETEEMGRLSAALQTILWRLDRQLGEMEARQDGSGEIVQDVRSVLAEYLAQLDRRLTGADAELRRA